MNQLVLSLFVFTILDCNHRAMSYMGDITKGTTLSPKRNFLSQTTSFVTSEVATYLASLVESIMQAYFTLL